MAATMLRETDGKRAERKEALRVGWKMKRLGEVRLKNLVLAYPQLWRKSSLGWHPSDANARADSGCTYKEAQRPAHLLVALGLETCLLEEPPRPRCALS